MTVQCRASLSTIKGPLPLGILNFQNPHDAIRISTYKEQLLSQKCNVVMHRRSMPASIKDSLQLVQSLSPFKRQVPTGRVYETPTTAQQVLQINSIKLLSQSCRFPWTCTKKGRGSAALLTVSWTP
jgi:hypothetical protein